MNPLILYNNIIADSDTTLTSSSLASGYNVQNTKDQRPYTLCKFAAAGTNYIEMSLGASTPVDTLFVCGHNLFTVGASVKLYGWSGSSYLEITGGSATPTNDNAFMLHFTGVSATKFKIVITNLLGLPYAGVVYLGTALEMEYPPDGPRSPFDEGISAEVSDSKTGNMLGASVNFNPLSFNHTYSNITRTWVQTNFIPFWNYAKLLNKFAYALDLTNEPDAVFLCRYKKDFILSRPASTLIYYDSLQINVDAER